MDPVGLEPTTFTLWVCCLLTIWAKGPKYPVLLNSLLELTVLDKPWWTTTSRLNYTRSLTKLNAYPIIQEYLEMTGKGEELPLDVLRAGNENRTHISSLEDWHTNHCTIPAYISLFEYDDQKTIKTDAVYFRRYQNTTYFNFIRLVWYLLISSTCSCPGI